MLVLSRQLLQIALRTFPARRLLSWGLTVIVVERPNPLVLAATSLASVSVLSAPTLYESHSRWRVSTS